MNDDTNNQEWTPDIVAIESAAYQRRQKERRESKDGFASPIYPKPEDFLRGVVKQLESEAADMRQQLARAEHRAESAEQLAAMAMTELQRITDEYEAFKRSAGVAPGWVYLIQERSAGHYKIGKSSKPVDRIKTFKLTLPFKVDFICVIPHANHHQLEKELHAMFADKHVEGEWYALGAQDVEFIRSLANAR